MCTLKECKLKHSNEIWLFVRRNYGTGKTLYAFKAAQAIQNNWSFIYLKSPELLADTLRMAKTLDKMVMVSLYLFEDIDQVTRGDEMQQCKIS
jgi:hypothetical protein